MTHTTITTTQPHFTPVFVSTSHLQGDKTPDTYIGQIIRHSRHIFGVLLLLLILTFAHQSVHAQTGSAQDSAATAPVLSGVRFMSADDLATCESRLLKVLDALEKAEALVGFKDREIAARVEIESLYKQAIAVKDLIIKFQDEYIQRLQKNEKGFMARLKSILKVAERVALIAVGIYIGGR